MLNNTDRRPAEAAGAAQSGADVVSLRSGFTRFATVLFALGAAIALVAGLAFSAGTAPKAEAQTCKDVATVETLKVDSSTQYASPAARLLKLSGLKTGDRVSRLEISNSSKSFGKSTSYVAIFQDSSGQLTHESYNGAKTPQSSGLGTKTITYVFSESPVGTSDGGFDVVVPISDNTASNFTVKATVTRQECTTPPPPTTSKEPSATPTPTTKPTTAPSTPTSAAPSTSGAQPTSTTPTSTTTKPTTPGSDPSTSTAQPTSTTPASPTVDPNAGTGERPADATKPGGNWIGIQIHARAFDQPWEGAPSNIQSQISPRGNDTRYSKGLRFRLYRSAGKTPFEASDMGPSTPINEPWATCVTNDKGTCTIYPPASVLDTGYFIIVQETEYPGSYHVPEINWGEYGNFNNRTGAQLPGFVNLRQRSDLFGSVIPMSYANTTPDNTSGAPLNSFGSSVQSLNNPPIEKARRCQASTGPRIALVMDTTASISAANGTQLYRDAVYEKAGSFLDSLQGTGASVAFFSFAADSPSNSPNYPQPISVDADLQGAKAAAKSALRGMGGVTNWERGLNAAKNAGVKYDEVIFVTDGDANHWGSGNTGVNVDGSVRGVEAAIFRANEIKEMGTRIVSIGVGQAETAAHWKGAGQLKAVSGPTYGEDYFGTDWNHLAATLRAAASQVLCQLEVTVDKTIVDSQGNRVADQSAANGWDMSINVSNIKSNLDGTLAGGLESSDPVYPAKLSGQNGVKVPVNGRIDDTRGTPDSSWMVTFYGDNGVDSSGKRIPNSASVSISENTASKQGYEFVAGQGSAGNYRGSWYEVKDIVSGNTLKTGALTDPKVDIGDQPQGRKVIVHMANRFIPEITLQKDLPNGRKIDSDQFSLEISKVTGAQNGAFVESPLGNPAVTQGMEKGLQKTRDGKPVQAGPFKLEPNTTYLLRENGSNNAKLSDYDTTLKCTGANAQPVPETMRGGTGRVWQVQTASNMSANINCTFTNTPVAASSISWKKIDNEKNPLACSQWQLTRTKDAQGKAVTPEKWVVNDNAQGATCTYPNSGLQEKKDIDPAPGSFKVDQLPLGTYFIEEVRAPEGYGVNDKRKSAEFVLTADNSMNGVVLSDAFINYPSTKTPGTLPRTGGHGIGLPAGIAILILGAGFAMLRRQRA